MPGVIEEAPAARERRVHRRGGRAGCDDNEVAQRTRHPARRAGAPRGAFSARAQRRHEHRPRAPPVDDEKGLLADHRRGVDRRVGRIGKGARRCTARADEHHVPVRAAPASERAVTGEPLLLAPRPHLAVHLRVGEEPAARPAAVVEHEIATDVHPPHRRRLRHRPSVESPRGHDSHVLDAAPEVQRRVPLSPPRVGAHATADHDVVGRAPESGDLCVEADAGVDVVRAGLEQHRIPSLTELARLLRGEDRVEPSLERRRGDAGIHDDDVRAEVRRGTGGLRGERRGERLEQEEMQAHAPSVARRCRLVNETRQRCRPGSHELTRAREALSRDSSAFRITRTGAPPWRRPQPPHRPPHRS